MQQSNLSYILAWLGQFGDIVRGVQRDDGLDVVSLVRPDTAHYSFQILVYEDGQLQVAARPDLDAPDSYFWYADFEVEAHREKADLHREFLETLERILQCRTRITQRRRWLFTSFVCEAYGAGGWQRIGGRLHSLRSQFRAPEIVGRSYVYSSPPIVEAIR